MATECRRPNRFRFQRKVVVDFDGSAISGEGGLIVLREFDARLGLAERLRGIVGDRRDRRYVEHDLLSLLRQRISQIAAGYEDANDATSLRNDPTMQAVAGRAGEAPASSPTLSRLENTVDWDSIRLLESEGTECFCRHGKTQEEIILDTDSTEDPTYGQQAFSFYNAHYDSSMYHPLLVFEATSGVLLALRLRPGNAMGSRQAIPLCCDRWCAGSGCGFRSVRSPCEPTRHLALPRCSTPRSTPTSSTPSALVATIVCSIGSWACARRPNGSGRATPTAAECASTAASSIQHGAGHGRAAWWPRSNGVGRG